jgi:hypothetical protein
MASCRLAGDATAPFARCERLLICPASPSAALSP